MIRAQFCPDVFTEIYRKMSGHFYIWLANADCRPLFQALHINAYIHSYIHTHACTYTYIHTYIHTSIHPSIHPFIHPYIHPSIHPSIHPYTHTYISGRGVLKHFQKGGPKKGGITEKGAKIPSANYAILSTLLTHS